MRRPDPAERKLEIWQRKCWGMSSVFILGASLSRPAAPRPPGLTRYRRRSDSQALLNVPKRACGKSGSEPSGVCSSVDRMLGTALIGQGATAPEPSCCVS